MTRQQSRADDPGDLVQQRHKAIVGILMQHNLFLRLHSVEYDTDSTITMVGIQYTSKRVIQET